GREMLADPMPAFIGFAEAFDALKNAPSFPTVAPAPAPTLPSWTAPSDAAAAALYPQSAVGRIFDAPMNGRCKITAPGTIGPTPASVLKPTFFSSRYRMTPCAVSRPNALP